MNDPLGPPIPVRIGGVPPTHWGWIKDLNGRAAITVCGRGSRCGPRAHPAGTTVDCSMCLTRVSEDPSILAPRDFE